jgi:hypothetical protein
MVVLILFLQTIALVRSLPPETSLLSRKHPLISLYPMTKRKRKMGDGRRRRRSSSSREVGMTIWGASSMRIPLQEFVLLLDFLLMN